MLESGAASGTNVDFDREKPAATRFIGLDGKVVQRAYASHAGARAAGILGSSAFAQCFSRSMTHLWIEVWKASST
jgi:hypothetical protein